MPTNPIDLVHGRYVHGRRVEVLARHLAGVIPEGARVLDVGCGDGLLASRVMAARPDVRVRGIDVLVRPSTHIEVDPFNGVDLPWGDGGFDVVLFVDVLHHVEDPMPLLREAVRVAGRSLVVKDHTREGLLAGPTLRFMDRVGNARHGVALPHNYWTRARWDAAVAELGLTAAVWNGKLGLYPAPTDWVFGRSLHFIARLDVPRG